MDILAIATGMLLRQMYSDWMRAMFVAQLSAWLFVFMMVALVLLLIGSALRLCGMVVKGVASSGALASFVLGVGLASFVLCT